MQWEFLVALAIAIPIILFPAAFVWYLNFGGVYHAIQDARRKRKLARGEKRGVVAEAEHIAARIKERELVQTK